MRTKTSTPHHATVRGTFPQFWRSRRPLPALTRRGSALENLVERAGGRRNALSSASRPAPASTIPTSPPDIANKSLPIADPASSQAVVRVLHETGYQTGERPIHPHPDQ